MTHNTQPSHSSLTPKQLQAFLNSPETLPLQDALIMATRPPQKSKSLFGLGVQFPTSSIKPFSMLWIETTKKPEIRDLARVHATDGPGTSVFTWYYINEGRLDCYFVLQVAMETPVHTSFRVPIYVREWSKLIDVLSQTGSLSLLPGPPVQWRELVNRVNTAELEDMIHAQSGGGITLTLSENVKRDVRHHFEQHIEAVVRLLGSG